MSSLTSPAVNKNITRFAPKVKQREHRRPSLKSTHLATTEQTAISTAPFTNQHLPAAESSTVQSKEPVSSTSSIPTTDSLNQSSTSTSPPSKSSTSKSISTISTSKPRRRRISSTPSNTFQPPSKGEHAFVAAPPSPEQEQLSCFDDDTAPQLPPTITTPIVHDNNSSTVDHQDHQPQPKRPKRISTSRTNPKIASAHVESLTTLDDITEDPAEPSLAQKPLSYFTNDLATGVVSRLYKENEQKKMATATQGPISAKTKANNTTPTNLMETMDDNDNGDGNSILNDSSSAPQVRLVDGEIVLDTSSLYIDKPLGQRQPVDYEVVEEDNTSRRINSQTYGKLVGKHGRRWTKNETNLFYQGLTQHGTDFEMITTMIPTRTRREIKLMFNRQEKVNPWKITASIMKKPNPPQNSSEGQTTE